MIKHAYILSIYFILTSFAIELYAQPYSFEVDLNNQPDNHIVLGKIRGDNFQPLDTILLHRGKSANQKKAAYTFSENSNPGMYRLDLGKTTYAKVMNEPPQQLDFIFNNEEIILETDFEAPEEDLLVVLSEENRVWFEFLQKEKNFQNQFHDLAVELVYYRKKTATIESDSLLKQNKTKWEATAMKYNEIQTQRSELIAEISERYPELFATKLIKMYTEPFLDGFLSDKERQEQFQKDFFNSLDFTDESLINSSVYTDKIFKYLTSYNRPGFTKPQLEQEYMKAVDVVLTNVNENQKVYEFILNYLVHGFEVLKMENVLNYIADNYSGTTCQTDEKTTLERKLESQKMKVGTTVPNFTLTDPEGFFVDFADVQSEKTVLVFWASWCPHCNEIIPAIKSWAADKENFEIVAISLDSSKSEWLNAVKELGIENWINLSDLKKWDGEVATKYNVYATPTMFVIDKERKIVAKPLTLQDLMGLNLE